MVLKTEKCAFSGLRVYPGHGTRLTKIDSTTFLFLNGKSKKMHAQKKKPAKLAWTTTYRKAHKKVRRTTRREIDVEYFTSLARARARRGRTRARRASARTIHRRSSLGLRRTIVVRDDRRARR
jgi:ribosomal protein L24E